MKVAAILGVCFTGFFTLGVLIGKGLAPVIDNSPPITLSNHSNMEVTARIKTAPEVWSSADGPPTKILSAIYETVMVPRGTELTVENAYGIMVITKEDMGKP